MMRCFAHAQVSRYSCVKMSRSLTPAEAKARCAFDGDEGAAHLMPFLTMLRTTKSSQSAFSYFNGFVSGPCHSKHRVSVLEKLSWLGRAWHTYINQFASVMLRES